MKKSLLLLIMAAAIIASAHDRTPISKTKAVMATCTGASPCKACKNCKYCKHCAKDGKTCGVCKKSN